MTINYHDEDNVERTATGSRIYKQCKIDNATRTDWSGLRITKASATMPKPTLKQRLISWVTLGLR
jgi:hypothetical protein